MPRPANAATGPGAIAFGRQRRAWLAECRPLPRKGRLSDLISSSRQDDATPDPDDRSRASSAHQASSGEGGGRRSGASGIIETIEPERLPKPDLPGTAVVVANTVEELVEQMATDLLHHSLNCLRAFGDFHLAVSGGATPEPLYRQLMIDPAYRGVPWTRSHLWVVDERRVPFTDERSNWNGIQGLLGDHAGIPLPQQHPIPAMEDDVEDRYEHEIQSALQWRERGQDRLDYILLGLGEDGHTASLFPHSPALRERERLVRVSRAPERTEVPERVTMTLPIINAARFIAIMVTGGRKQAIVERIAREHRARRTASKAGAGGASIFSSQIEALPVLNVHPVGGVVYWYLDRAACPPVAPSARPQRDGNPPT